MENERRTHHTTPIKCRHFPSTPTEIVQTVYDTTTTTIIITTTTTTTKIKTKTTNIAPNLDGTGLEEDGKPSSSERKIRRY